MAGVGLGLGIGVGVGLARGKGKRAAGESRRQFVYLQPLGTSNCSDYSGNEQASPFQACPGTS